MTDLSKIDTTVNIAGVAIHQPVTTLTGALIGVFCFYFYLQLSKLNITNSYSKHWKLFFLYLGIASFIGACSHAFFAVHEGISYKILWLSSQAFDGFCVYAAQQATLNSILFKSANFSKWKKSYNIQLALYIIAVLAFQNFIVAVIGFAVGLIPVMIIHFKNGKTNKANMWIAYGILISFLTAFIHIFKIALNAYFNHLDIAHVFAIINVSVMYVGIKQQVDQSIVA